MIIYLDLVLAVNFSFNLILLIITGWMGLQQFKIQRYLLSALAGTIIWLIFFLSNQYIFIDWLCRIAGGLAMVLIAWRPVNLRGLVSKTVMLVVAGQLMGGGIFSLVFALGTTPLGIQSVSIGVVSTGAALMLIVAAIWIGRLHKTKQLVSYVGEVTIIFQGTTIQLPVLLDSGNILRHPVNNWPVVIIERKPAAQLFTSQVMDWAEEPLSMPPPGLETRIGLIPFNSVGGSGMLATIRPDRVVLTSAQGKKNLTQVYIAIRQKNQCPLEYQAVAFPVDNWEEGEII